MYFLSRLQRLACLCITGAIRSTPTAAMETMLNLPPLDIYVRGEARIAAYRLSKTSNWKPHIGPGHTRIEKLVTDPILEMGTDTINPRISYDKPFKICLDWEEWRWKETENPNLV